MRYLKNLILFCFILSLYSCGTVKEGFTNQKKENKDEFLVEKKSPLVMPPNYDVLPAPNSSMDQNENQDTNFKSLITDKEDQTDKINQEKNDQNFEENILEKIKNN